MADELLLCPFCGGDAWSEREFWQGAAPAGSLFSDDVGCPNCGVWLPPDVWNRRDACFHCQFGAKPMTEENMRELGWVREHTCHPERPMFNGFPIVNGKPHCSRCGMDWERLPIKPAYCPTCGARVMRDGV